MYIDIDCSERNVVDYQRRIEYAALKQRWQETLEPETVAAMHTTCMHLTTYPSRLAPCP